MSDSEDSGLALDAQIEALLFVASEPATAGELADALAVPAKTVELELENLERRLAGRGIQLQRHAGRLQLTTAPSLASKIEHFLGLEARSHLSRAALETLAIIAYNQPATRPQVDAIRGVNSDTMLKSLLTKGLIHEMGRSQGPGRPILYSTTPDFLQYLGLRSIADLPALQAAERLGSTDETLKG